MLQSFFSEHWSDEEERPAGGVATGRGFTISWQNGPLGRGNERKEPNGAFVETMIVVCINRLQFYQRSEFACEENEEAIEKLFTALGYLELRTKRRKDVGTEGTHKGS